MNETNLFFYVVLWNVYAFSCNGTEVRQFLPEKNHSFGSPADYIRESVTNGIYTWLFDVRVLGWTITEPE